VSETARCPYCGSPAVAAAGSASGPARGQEGPQSAGERGLDPLYREVRRIRELAESRAVGDGERRVAELTREVAELRATVARLRGSAMAGPAS